MSGSACQDFSPPNRSARREFIFNFHGVGKPGRELVPGEERFWLSVDAFERSLDRLAELDPSRSKIGITFDDGNISDIEIALPRLLARKLTARFFVLAGRLDAPQFLSSSDLKELRRAGMKIGTHGVNHVDWRFASDQVLDRELNDSRTQISGALGEPIDEIAVPYGAYDRRVLRWLLRSRYAAVFTSDGGSCASKGWLRPRTCIRADTELSDLDDIVSRTGFVSTAIQDARLLKRQMFPARERALG